MKLAALFITLIHTRNDLLRSIVTTKEWHMLNLNSFAPEPISLDSPKKNELLVRIINTQRMPRRVDMHCTPSPVLPD